MAAGVGVGTVLDAAPLGEVVGVPPCVPATVGVVDGLELDVADGPVELGVDVGVDVDVDVDDEV